MQIRYQPRGGIQDVEIRDITGGSPYAGWHAGDVREVPDDAKVIFRQASGKRGAVRAIDAIFSAGPDWIDDATGVNPLFACATCGAVTMDEAFLDPRIGTPTPYRTDPADLTSPRLCVPDFLAAHPELEAAHVRAGIDPAIIEDAHSRRDAPDAAPEKPKHASKHVAHSVRSTDSARETAGVS
jgi:hypothetical protein